MPGQGAGPVWGSWLMDELAFVHWGHVLQGRLENNRQCKKAMRVRHK